MWEYSGVVRELTATESWRLLRVGTFGRLAVAVAGRIDIYLVGYTVDGHDIVFRSSVATTMFDVNAASQVAFEIDGRSSSDAWTVVAKGRADRVEGQPESDIPETFPLSPWVSRTAFPLVRISLIELTGRAFVLGRPAP